MPVNIFYHWKLSHYWLDAFLVMSNACLYTLGDILLKYLSCFFCKVSLHRKDIFQVYHLHFDYDNDDFWVTKLQQFGIINFIYFFLCGWCYSKKKILMLQVHIIVPNLCSSAFFKKKFISALKLFWDMVCIRNIIFVPE